MSDSAGAGRVASDGDETAEGRAEFVARQRDFAARAHAIRARLIAELDVVTHA